MIPIPHDPLALPYSNKSDPIRGPIFVPLNLKCLEDRDRIFIGIPCMCKSWRLIIVIICFNKKRIFSP